VRYHGVADRAAEPRSVSRLNMIAVILTVSIVLFIFWWLIFGDRLAPGEPATQTEFVAQRISIGFDDLEAAGWAVDGPLVWSYTFVHDDYPELVAFMKELRDLRYDVAEIEEINDRASGLVDYRLRVEKMEQHSPTSMAIRHQEFADLMSRLQINEFDSWYPTAVANCG
jgi:NAD-dependent oxidoreductase involved in siderophore biosynthesis